MMVTILFKIPAIDNPISRANLDAVVVLQILRNDDTRVGIQISWRGNRNPPQILAKPDSYLVFRDRVAKADTRIKAC